MHSYSHCKIISTLFVCLPASCHPLPVALTKRVVSARTPQLAAVTAKNLKQRELPLFLFSHMKMVPFLFYLHAAGILFC